MEQVLINKTTLTAIGDAIRGKESSTELIPVNDMASRIANMSSGKKFTTGTVTFAKTANTQTITHNLGTIPSVFALYPTNFNDFPQGGTDEAKGVIRGFVSVLMPNDFLCQTDNQGNTNNGSFSWQPCDIKYGNSLNNITETTIVAGAYGQSYKYQADKEYSWIAIE